MIRTKETSFLENHTTKHEIHKFNLLSVFESLLRSIDSKIKVAYTVNPLSRCQKKNHRAETLPNPHCLCERMALFILLILSRSLPKYLRVLYDIRCAMCDVRSLLYLYAINGELKIL